MQIKDAVEIKSPEDLKQYLTTRYGNGILKLLGRVSIWMLVGLLFGLMGFAYHKSVVGGPVWIVPTILISLATAVFIRAELGFSGPILETSRHWLLGRAKQRSGVHLSVIYLQSQQEPLPPPPYERNC